jgi:hypothetical protein
MNRARGRVGGAGCSSAEVLGNDFVKVVGRGRLALLGLRMHRFYTTDWIYVVAGESVPKQATNYNSRMKKNHLLTALKRGDAKFLEQSGSSMPEQNIA